MSKTELEGSGTSLLFFIYFPFHNIASVWYIVPLPIIWLPGVLLACISSKVPRLNFDRLSLSYVSISVPKGMEYLGYI